MNYVVEFSRQALDDVASAGDLITEKIFAQFEKKLELLEDSPTKWSFKGPGGAAYPLGQYYTFSCIDEGGIVVFNILFKFHSDEQTLYALRVGITKIDPNTMLL